MVLFLILYLEYLCPSHLPLGFEEVFSLQMLMKVEMNDNYTVFSKNRLLLKRLVVAR